MTGTLLWFASLMARISGYCMVSSNVSTSQKLAPILPPRDGAYCIPGVSSPYRATRDVEDKDNLTKARE
ncbi:hypothetical protein KC361_g40 [Hortaea werneckii]|nr:hypothetical protein KC361_g40 [Hortaea werneckii]